VRTTISANGEAQIARILPEGHGRRSANEGVISPFERKEAKTAWKANSKLVEGMQFDRGYLSLLLRDQPRQEMVAELEDVYILPS